MENKYKFFANVNIDNNPETTGTVTVFDTEQNKLLCAFPVKARDHDHFTEIAMSIKKRFLEGTPKE
ncbi:hypothetical protein P9E34_04035 [Schinkia azotoformans]|uniref:hypothetical protein n=1 Tax=Schinkia azotoformans TaxID=1454 RepID=UPI002DBAB4EA|nr:hypothetical protein [Schinkia azotoformans]MEC1723915.1 hypothetical protein [Schinkia azotoformans]